MIDDFDSALNTPSSTPAPMDGDAAPAPMPEDEFDFVDEANLDPTKIITIHTNGAQPKFVVVEAPMVMRDVMVEAHLTWNGQLDIFVEGAPITLDSVVAGGTTVTLVGNVKGG